MELLDIKCAECGADIAENPSKETETVLRKCIGVLQEDGVYAFFLYLAAEKKKESESVRHKAFAFMKDSTVFGNLFMNAGDDPLPAIREKLNDKLDDTLLVKELLERVLVYALYHTRAATKTVKARAEAEP